MTPENETNPSHRGRDLGLLGAGLLGATVGYAAIRRAQKRKKTARLLHDRKIVILGAGFAGIQAALDLANVLPPEEDDHIILINEQNYLLFTPMLTEVAGGDIDPRHIVSPLRLLSPMVTFIQGRVDRVDLQNKRVDITLDVAQDTVPHTHRTVEGDFLVIALGSVINFYDIPGLERYSFPMKNLGDALAVNTRVLSLLERADAEPDPEVRRALLTFVVGGGGFSGVETMAAVNDLIRDACSNYPHIPAGEIRTILIHSRERLLQELDEGLAVFAQQKLEERSVECRMNCRITGAGKDYVEINGNERIPTYCLIWTAGTAVHPVIPSLECEHGKQGAIKVKPTCELVDHPGVWAMGDCAEVPTPDGKGRYAPTAQNAIRQGSLVAKNIVATLRDREQQPFVFEPIAELALVGKRSGIARVYKFKFSGILAWALWRTVYLSKIPDWQDRVRVGVDWLLDLFLGREISVLPTTRPARAEVEEREESLRK